MQSKSARSGEFRFGSRVGQGRSRANPVHQDSLMTRAFRSRNLTLPWAGVVTSLLALALFAPPMAKAGCSHLVLSRSHLGPSALRLDPVIGDPSRAEQSDRAPTPSRPCSGAFCSEQPAAPAAPAGAFDARVGSWACRPSIPGSSSPDSSFLSLESSALHAVRHAGFVFHPPRPLAWA